MGKKSPPPKAPDLQPITDAQIKIAEQSNELAREYLGMSREQFAWMQENSREELALAREQADKLFEFQEKAFASGQEAEKFARKVGQSQIDAMNLQMDYAKRDRDRYEKTFLPMQDQYIKEASQYDTAARREGEASRAMVDIQRQSEAARNNADARLRSMGLDPSQMRSASLLQSQDVAMAANQALAGNAARQGVEDRGRAMRADALNVGAGLPAQALAGFAGAGAAGQGALGAGQAGQNAQLGAIQGGAGVAGQAMGFRSSALNNVAQLTGSPMQWAGMGGNMLGQSSNAYGNAANTSSQNFQNQMSSWKAGQEQAQQSFNNIMSVASVAGGMMMAEGGEVRRYAEGGGVSPVSRERFPMAKALLSVDDVDTPVSRPSTQMRGPSMLDRFDAGMSTPGADAGNVWAGQTSSDPQITIQQAQLGGDNMRYAAEGGAQRARGALPVRQVRDKIPAYLAEGEFIVPEDVVRAKGLEFFDKLVKKFHRENA